MTGGGWVLFVYLFWGITRRGGGPGKTHMASHHFRQAFQGRRQILGIGGWVVQSIRAQARGRKNIKSNWLRGLVV
ncbi:hypothetical protein B0T25DRAFT_535593 [Lasiosphaeria hispida]|uniref:Secreted protein n=1 Tax=Lasiosphaeria hispida TaxID=260671 RepID=A0AAJ0MIJ8_9PEZI|nr:hypothetical protein B0T25DRAFT_535593 [Lasiosphaeria hispida]